MVAWSPPQMRYSVPASEPVSPPLMPASMKRTPFAYARGVQLAHRLGRDRRVQHHDRAGRRPSSTPSGRRSIRALVRRCARRHRSLGVAGRRGGVAATFAPGLRPRLDRRRIGIEHRYVMATGDDVIAHVATHLTEP
jgi:hypothetical protein